MQHACHLASYAGGGADSREDETLAEMVYPSLLGFVQFPVSMSIVIGVYSLSWFRANLLGDRQVLGCGKGYRHANLPWVETRGKMGFRQRG